MKNHPCPGEGNCPVCYDVSERRVFDLESQLATAQAEKQAAERERDSLRAQLAEARKEALEEAARIADGERAAIDTCCDALLVHVADAIRALKELNA